MTPSKLLDLAERVEMATGADRELDFAIFRALGWEACQNPTFAGGLVGRWVRPGGSVTGHDGPPLVTASLDAAVSLVPQGWGFSVSTTDDRERFASAACWTEGNVCCRGSNSGEAIATPALALLAAALRARAAQAGDA